MNNDIDKVTLEGLFALTGIDVALFEEALKYQAAEKASTIDEALEAYVGAGSIEGAAKIALAKWEKLVMAAVMKTVTFEEALEVFKQAVSVLTFNTDGSPALTAAEEKVLSLCLTFEQAEASHKATPKHLFYSPFSHRMEQLALTGAEEASTVEQAIIAHTNAVKAGYAVGKALQKWQNLAAARAREVTNLQEAMAAYEIAPPGINYSFSAKTIALNRWIRFASTIEEVKSAYVLTKVDSKEARYALLKMYRLYKKHQKKNRQ